jgi:hypothetical protein
MERSRTSSIKLFRYAGSVLFMSLLIAGVVWLQQRRLDMLQSPVAGSQSVEQLQMAERQEGLRLQLLQRTPSFGFDNLVADWTFLNFLQYFGNYDLRSQVGYRISPEFFEVIVAEDPYFVLPYLFLSVSTSIYAAEPEWAVGLMTQGLEYMTPEIPEGGYRVWRYKGLDELLFLGDGEAARQSFEMAVEWAEKSNEPDAVSVAQAARQTVDFLAENPVGKAARISAWIQILNYAVDETTQKLAIEQIQELGGEILVNEGGQVTVRYRTDE